MHIVNKIHVQLRRLLLLFVLCLLTGCTVEYNMNISSSGISEKIVVLDNIGLMSEYEAKSKLNNLVDANMGNGGMLDNNYDLKQIINDESYGLSITLDDIGKYNLTFKDNCFESFEINQVEDYYELKTSGKFTCLKVWNKDYAVDVNIHIDGKIIDSNAEQINGKTLSWTIMNEKGTNLYIKYKLSDNKKSNLVSIIIIGMLVIGIICAIIYFVNGSKKANEI